MKSLIWLHLLSVNWWLSVLAERLCLSHNHFKSTFECERDQNLSLVLFTVAWTRTSFPLDHSGGTRPLPNHSTWSPRYALPLRKERKCRSFSDSKSLHPAAWPTGRGSGSASAVSQNFGSTFLLWVTKFGGLEENFCQSLVPQTGHLGPHGPTDFDRKVCSRSQLRRFPPGEVMSGQERDRGPRWGRGSILQTGPVCQVGSDHWSSE